MFPKHYDDNHNEPELSAEHSYDVELIDVWNMTRKTILTGVRGKIQVKLPGKEGTALLALCRE